MIKPQPTKPVETAHDWEWKPGGMLCYDDYFREHAPDHCPYGQVGDRLWCKENFCQSCHKDNLRDDDGELFVCYQADLGSQWEGKPPCVEGKWTPSIFMPRWASRITLEIISIRVERLQEISQADIKAKGIDAVGPVPINTARLLYKAKNDTELSQMLFRDEFAGLWDNLNAKRGYPWESNPWVWVIEFKVIPQKIPIL